MSLGRSLPDLLWLLGAAALVWFASQGPPPVEARRPVALVADRLPADAPPPGPDYERLVEVGTADLERSLGRPLVPDPQALRVRVTRRGGERVLDPDALRLVPLATPRAGRPLALELLVSGAEASDVIEWRVGEAAFARAPARAVLELPALPESATTIEVRWSGKRAERGGAVRAVFELVPLPPPGFWLGPGLETQGPLARALAVQGWRSAASADAADLLVLSTGRAVPAEVPARVDRGLGVLFVAEADRGLAPSVLELAPVVAGVPSPGPTAKAEPVPAAGDQPEEPGPARPEPRRETPSPARRAEPGQPAAEKPEADALRRPGEVGARETEAARAAAKQRRTKSIALVLVVDRSGSMSFPPEAPRIQMAKRGALATAEALGSGDEFALVAFGTRPEVVLPLGPADRLGALREALERLDASAADTRCYPALQVAWEMLKRTADPFPIRHVVILTDGEFRDPNMPYDVVLAQMQREGIGVSALGVTDPDDPLSVGAFSFLKSRLAAVGGALKTTSSSTEIPRLLLGEVQEVLAAAAPMPHEGKAAGAGAADEPGKDLPPPAEPPRTTPPVTPPVAAGPTKPPTLALHAVDLEPVLAGFGDVKWPSVLGLAPLEARARARVHLAAGALGHAFLASAPHGLGRVAIWAGTDGAPWCGELVAQPWFPRLAGQLAAWLARPGGSDEAPAAAWRLQAKEVLEGDGVPDAVLADLARRLGATVGGGPPLGEVRAGVPGRPAPWLLAAAALLCLMLGIERGGRARGARHLTEPIASAPAD